MKSYAQKYLTGWNYNNNKYRKLHEEHVQSFCCSSSDFNFGTRSSNGGRKLSEIQVKKEWLLMFIMDWNLARWVRKSYRRYAWRPCCMAGTIKMFCIRMNILYHRNNIVLFLACSLAAMQNLYRTRKCKKMKVDNLIVGALRWPPSLVTKPLVMIDVIYAQNFNKIKQKQICR